MNSKDWSDFFSGLRFWGVVLLLIGGLGFFIMLGGGLALALLGVL